MVAGETAPTGGRRRCEECSGAAGTRLDLAPSSSFPDPVELTWWVRVQAGVQDPGGGTNPVAAAAAQKQRERREWARSRQLVVRSAQRTKRATRIVRNHRKETVANLVNERPP